MDKSLARKALFEWFEKNNQGGLDYSKPPPDELLRQSFPGEDDEQIEYWMRKPARIFERIDDD